MFAKLQLMIANYACCVTGGFSTFYVIVIYSSDTPRGKLTLPNKLASHNVKKSVGYLNPPLPRNRMQLCFGVPRAEIN